MELDEYKMRLKDRQPGEALLPSADELEGYIRKRTNSIADKIKRSIQFELAACIVFVGAAVWSWFTYPIAYVRAFSLLCICLCCFLLPYMGAVYRKITAYEKAPMPVKNSLQQVIAILEQFIRVYFQFSMITLPILFIFGLITGILSVKGTAMPQHFNWQRAMLYYTGWFIFWSAFMYFFSKWYIKKLYGNHLQQLKEQLKDIENG